MTLKEKILLLFRANMDPPEWLGSFHIASIVFVLLLCTVTVILAKKADEKQTDKFVLTFSAVMLFMEVIRQILAFSQDSDGNIIYNWSLLPLHLCAMPMYFGLIGSLSKGKIKQWCYSFCLVYGMLGGTLVMIFPMGVFGSSAFFNIQSMLHHGLMIMMALTIAVSRYQLFSTKHFAQSFILFVLTVALATAANIITYKNGITNCNMFFLNPYIRLNIPRLPIPYVNELWATLPSAALIAAYIAAATVIAAFLNWILYISFSRKYTESSCGKSSAESKSHL